MGHEDAKVSEAINNHRNNLGRYMNPNRLEKSHRMRQIAILLAGVAMLVGFLVLPTGRADGQSGLA
ncbi:MAG TPA: hypothetical protein VKB88_27385 [Bryobacteraceae bacterium]|nr:hypothetical protein [Bryobacteraceae bacterium]